MDADIRTLLGTRNGRIEGLVGETPELAVVLQFVSDLIDAFDAFRERSDRPQLAAQLRLKTNERICQLVRAITKADCVFTRLVQTDGSVQLYHVDGDRCPLVWSDPNNPVGRPPEEKEAGEGVSGIILNGTTTTPLLIWDIFVDDRFREAHERSLQRHPADTEEGKFVHSIRAESCVPIRVQQKVLAGIVAVRWQTYSEDEAAVIEAALRQWQGVFASLYHAGLQLERREKLHGLIQEVGAALSAIASALTRDEYLRKVVTLLTCDAGLGWHRAFVFLFDDAYPSAARCVMAVGGVGDPAWRTRQTAVRGWNLAAYLLRTEFDDFASDDPLFQFVSNRPECVVISEQALASNKLLHAFLLGEEDSSLNSSDPFPLPTDSAWLRGLSGIGEVFKQSAGYSECYLVPLYQPSTGLPIGFILVDAPYAHPVENGHNLPLTQLTCNLVAAHLAERGIGGLSHVTQLESLEFSTAKTYLHKKLSELE